MDKMDMVVAIQHLLAGLKEETANLEISINEILSGIGNEVFISEAISNSAITHLRLIQVIQKECEEKYLSLMESTEFPGTVNEVKAELNHKAEALAVCRKYLNAIRKFCRLHSVRFEPALTSLKLGLDPEGIYKLTEKDCQEKYGRYVEFVDAFDETNPEKLLEYSRILSEHFEAGLVLELIQKKLTIRETVLAEGLNPKNVAEDDNTGNTIAESDVSFTFRQLIVNNHVLAKSKSKNEKNDVGIKALASELNGPSKSLRITILRYVCEYKCATDIFLQYIIDEDKADIERECFYLVDKGYLKKYTIDELNVLYRLTYRGLKAFLSGDSVSFMGVGLPKNKSEIILDGPDKAMIYLMRSKAFLHAEKILKVESILYDKVYLELAMLFMVCKKDDVHYVFTTMIDSDERRYDKYCREFNDIKRKWQVTEDSAIFALSYHREHAQKIRDILSEKFGCRQVGSYIFSEDAWYDKNGNKLDGSVAEKNNPEADLRKEEPVPNTVPVSAVVPETAVPVQDAVSAAVTDAVTEETAKEAAVVTPVVIKTRSRITEAYQNMICEDKMYCATAYLKAASAYDPKNYPVYRKLAYAVNDPMEKCSYTSDNLIAVYFDEEASVVNDYFMISALVRNYFMDHIKYDHSMQQLLAMTKENDIMVNNGYLSQVVYQLFNFKEETHSGIDQYADYRAKDKMAWEDKLALTRKEAAGHYEAYVESPVVERGSHKRFLETQKIIFAKNGDIATCLKTVIDNESEAMELVKDFLKKYFIKLDAPINQINIDDGKINSYIDCKWEDAIQSMMFARKNSDLIGSFRMNLYKRLQKVVKVLCDWTVLVGDVNRKDNDAGAGLYKKTVKAIIKNMDNAAEILKDELGMTHETEEIVGKKVLLYTITELRKRLVGDYSDEEGKYFYIGFLRNSRVLLDAEYLPLITESVHELEDFSPLERIYAHSREPEINELERLKQIFDSDDDFGTARLLLMSMKNKGMDETQLVRFAPIEELVKDAAKRAEIRKTEFIENLELAQSYGQIDNTLEDKKDKILQSASQWYERCNASGNFGFFERILKAFDEKIRKEAKNREVIIKKELESYCNHHQNLPDDERTKERIIKIKKMIEQQNYTVAEDLIHRLANEEVESEVEMLQNDYLQDFIDNYDYNYKLINDAGRMVTGLVNTTMRVRKDTRGGRRLVENWLSNGGQRLGEPKLKNLLATLGFSHGEVQEQNNIADKIENYNVYLKKPENGRKSNYKHPVAAFGSCAEEEGFRVVCLYGTYDTDRLLRVFKEIGTTKHTLVFLDYALQFSDRQRLARKIKIDAPSKIFSLIDRVALMYLINNYDETLVNRMLMAIMMPYSYYQPYVIKSADIMPPEMFIGRKEELDKIESPVGVNIVYGGRQLGKSALLRRAKEDIDVNENGDRAVLVDIKGLDYQKAVHKIAQALTDAGVFTRDIDSNNWEDLSHEIKKRLSSSREKKIPYLLLLLDEADDFIESCEKVDFAPFDALKDIQSIGRGRFKFVVAGLRNIVRFKQNVALGNNSVLTHLSSITVKPFNVMDARELLEIPLFYLGLRFPPEKDALVSMILATVNYFPGLLQMYCAKLLEAMKKDYAGYNENETPPYVVQENHIKKVLSEAGFQQDIREKFMITLRVGNDDYYYIIALLMAYLYCSDDDNSSYSAEDIIEVAKEFRVAKVVDLKADKVGALMDEMKELNVLRMTVADRYLFTRYSFYQMMGTQNQIEDEIMNYMEG